MQYGSKTSMVASKIASTSLIEIAQKTRQSASELAVLSAEERNSALEAIATALETATPETCKPSSTTRACYT